MEAVCSSETSVNFHQTTRRYIPKDGTFIMSHNFKAVGIYGKSKVVPVLN
jgi:hypothetical protein